MFHSAIKPSAKACLKEGGTYTFTIPDFFQSMVAFVKNITDFDSTLERVSAAHDKFKIYPNKPFVVVWRRFASHVMDFTVQQLKLISRITIIC
jgi:hypothetical protein